MPSAALVSLGDRLIAGDITAAKAIGLDLFTHWPAGVSDATVEAYHRPTVGKAAFALSADEAWALLACVAVLGLLLISFAGALQPRGDPEPGADRAPPAPRLRWNPNARRRVHAAARDQIATASCFELFIFIGLTRSG